jgi:GH15 family glucan-1,4-alpha-glucosidase
VDALYASGQQQDAIDLFERLLGLRNDVGLLSEEWDPAAQRQLGNTPRRSATLPWSSARSSCTWIARPAVTARC